MRLLSLLVLLLLLAPAPAADPAVTAVKDAETITFKDEAGQTIAVYRFAGRVPDPAAKTPGATKDLAKPFFYPVFAATQIPVTRGWPVAKQSGDATTDHPHQKSAWFCHGDVIPEGIDLKVKSADKRVHGIDFWAEGGNHGRIVCVEVGEPVQVSKDHVRVPTRNEWRAADGTKVLDESRTIHAIDLPAGRLLVLEIDLHASVCPVTFGDTKEGAMGVRVNDAIRADPKAKTGGTLTNAAGKASEKEVWGYPADWVDYFGRIGDQTAGVAVFDDPRNPHRANWHARGYGLLAANPFGRAASGFPSQKGKTELVKLAKGEHLKLRYGIYTHGGDTAAGKVAEAYKAFAAAK
jgi:hypothetical protein